MPTPNKDNVEARMAAFEAALSGDDKDFLVRMAQEPEQQEQSEEDKK